MAADILIHNDKSRIDIDYVFHYLHHISYWAKGRPRSLIERGIENSFCFIVEKNGKQIGFARVISDFATFGYLADVFIDENQRGYGYGKLLIEHILEHPQLKYLKRWMLLTGDAHGLYKQYGFNPPAKPEIVMEKVRKDYVES
ncbi:MAG: GNAT family N-acetyltransferase [Bacteroidia bacterium]|nr:GNAT family N-acetyltransferase [Bacteroidia bacterium]